MMELEPLFTHSVQDEEGLTLFLDRLEEQLMWVQTTLGQLWFRRYTTRQPVAGIKELEATRAELLRDFSYQELIDRWAGQVTDPLLARRLQLWQQRFAQARLAGHPEELALRQELADAIINFEYRVGDRVVPLGEVRQILRASPDRDLRRAAWLAAAPLSAQLAPRVRELFGLRQRLAGGDYVNFQLRQQGLERAQVEGLLRELQAATQPLYDELLVTAAERLGVDDPKPWDIQYLLENGEGDLPVEAFSTEAIEPRLHAFAAAHGLDLQALGISVHWCDIPYNGLCMTLTPKDIRILGNPAPGHSYYRTAFHELGHALHSALDRQEGPILRGGPAVFAEAMAETLAYVTRDPAWLADLGVSGAAPRGPWFHYLRQRSAYALFEYAAYDDPGADLDGALAALEAEFLGGGVDLTPRWAANAWFVSYPVYWQNYVLADLIASQVHKTLREQFGGLYGKPEAIRFLAEQYWAPGNTVDWQEKLLRSTGEPLGTAALVADLR